MPAATNSAESGEASITGAFGTIHHDDQARNRGMKVRILTLLAILGPGIIVMVGDNDAGGVSTYAQAGQNYRPLAALDPAVADPGAHRQPRDGGALGGRDRRRPRSAHQGALRQALGCDRCR